MLDHFKRMFAYNHWANREVLTNLQSIAAGPPPDTLRLVGHVLGAEALWLDRIQKKPDGPVWPEFDLAQCQVQADNMKSAWSEYLAQSRGADLDAVVHYVNSKGEAFDSQIEDILHHVLFHSHYHRGQIARAVRGAGHVPAYTDYIQAVRMRLVE